MAFDAHRLGEMIIAVRNSSPVGPKRSGQPMFPSTRVPDRVVLIGVGMGKFVVVVVLIRILAGCDRSSGGGATNDWEMGIERPVNGDQCLLKDGI